jgi:hypothetical protein
MINVSNAASTTNVSFDAVVGLFGFVRDSFVGNGTEVNFTLSGAPLNEDNALVFVDRILQRNSEYNVSATTLTFTGAPDNGSVIDVFGTQYMSGNAAVLRTGDTMTGELNVSAKLITQNIEPAANITYNLGTNTKRFKDLYLSNSTIYLGDVQISANAGKLVVPAIETSSGINLESQVANSYAQANAAYNAANTKVNATGGSITGDLSITGNLTVQGNATTINVSNLSVNDSIMLLAANGTGDSLDIGFIGHIQRDATDTHVGLIRKAVENQFYLFDNYEVEPTNNIINVSGNNFRLANLKLGIANANTFVTSAGLDVTGQANAAYGAANNRVLKAGDTMTGQLNISSGGLLVTGSVGIGTTNPATTLHVDASGGGIVRVSRLGAGAGILQLEADGTDGAISTTNVMRFQTNSVERMRIDTAGAVCIGTNSNTSRGGSNAKLLTYKSSGTNYFDIQCGTSGDSGLLFSSSSSSAYGLINYSNSLNDMLFYTNSAERMRILSGGNVGIGTTSPGAKLQVNGGVRVASNTWIDTDNSVNLIRDTRFGYSDSYRAVQVGVAGSTRAISLGYDVSTNLSGGFTGNEIVIPNNKAMIAPTSDNSAFVGVLRIDSANNLCLGGGNHQTSGHIFVNNVTGYVGIGTGSPRTALHAVSSGAAVSTTATVGSNMHGLTLTATTNESTMTGVWFGTGSAAGTHWCGIAGARSNHTVDWSTHLGFYTHVNTTSNLNDATEKMRITGEGDVGIGTTSPAYKLDVRGAISSNSVAPISLTAGGNNGSFDKTTIYHGQNSTSNSLENGIFIERGRLTDSGTAEIRSFVIGSRGGQTQFVVNKDGSIGIGGETPATSGVGIKFPATQSAVSDANTLDDYEEGTWTAVLRGAVTAGTYETQFNNAQYTKIGRQVTATLSMQLASPITGGGSTYAQITGLPFTKMANSNFVGAVRFNNVDFTGSYVVVQFVSSSATSVLYFSEIVDNGATIDLPISAFSAADIIEFTITYFV